MRTKLCQSLVCVYSLSLGILVSFVAAPSKVFAGGGSRDITSLPVSPVGNTTPLYSPTVNTNLTSYSEGDNVVIGGKYFPPNTIVFLKVGHVDGICTCAATAHQSWAVVTNAIGSFATSWHIGLNLSANMTLVIKANGAAGSVSSTTFVANLTGAIWTTDQCGADVNGNIYGSCEPPSPLECSPKSPFLNGGPHNHNCGAAGGLPDGDFYFQVTDPSGAVLLSSDGVEKRQFHVECGVITQYANLPGSVASHVLGTGFCPTHDSCPASVGIALWPFDPTPNPGGEYKCWVTRVSDYDLSNPLANFGFRESESKTDNYKCAQSVGTGSCCTACKGDPQTLGECADNVTEAECQSVGGQFHLDGACDEQPCEICEVNGACCIPATPGNPTHCIETTEADCTGQGGIFNGGGTECTTETCPPGGCILQCPDNRDLGCNPDPSDYACHPENVNVNPGDCIDGEITCTPGEIISTGCNRSRTNTYHATSCDGIPCECTQTLTWTEDTTDPELHNCPTGGSLPCNSDPTCTTVLDGVTATDNCDTSITPTCEQIANDLVGCTRTRTFRITATDDCLNDTTCEVTYTWTEDTTDPELHNCPTGGSLPCNSDPTCTTVLDGVTATDNCDTSITPTCEQIANDLVGCTRTRTFRITATDDCLNDTTCEVTYTWTEDVDPPDIFGCDNVTVNAEAGTCCAHVEFNVTATDECDGPLTAHCDHNSGSCFPVGSTLVTCTATDSCTNPAQCSFTINVRGSICGKKFYDANVDGIDNDGQVVAGWLIQLKDSSSVVIGTTHTAADGTYCFNVLPGSYNVCEVIPPNSHWVASTPLCVAVQITAENCRGTANFGNYCTVSSGNGRTLGFWSNNNGKNILQANDSAWRTLLNGFCLRNADGTNYDVPIPPTSFTTARTNFRTWLLNANATNMARMLSTQMAATRLNVEYMGLNGSANVLLPANLAACYGAPIANINAVIAAANTALCADGNTLEGNANRTSQECLKDICDKINNNVLQIISGDPCAVIYP